jgi:ABC-type transporter MlaC component
MRLTVFAIALAGIVLAAPAFADPAADRLQAYDDQVIAIMKAKLPLGARVTRFEGLVSTYYDMPTIASLVVGPAWASTSAADKTAAIAALTRHSAVSLARNFASYGGERFTIDPNVTTRGPSRVVKLTIASGNSSNVLLYPDARERRQLAHHRCGRERCEPTRSPARRSRRHRSQRRRRRLDEAARRSRRQGEIGRPIPNRGGLAPPPPPAIRPAWPSMPAPARTAHAGCNPFHR